MTENEDYIEDYIEEDYSEDMLPDERSLVKARPAFDQENFTFENSETTPEKTFEDLSQINSIQIKSFLGEESRTVEQPMSLGINDNIINILAKSTPEIIKFPFELELDIPKIELLSALFNNLDADKDLVLDRVVQNLMQSNDAYKLVRDKIKEKLLTLI